MKSKKMFVACLAMLCSLSIFASCGSESNDYGAADPLRTWEMTKEGMRRIRTQERDRILAQNRLLYRK